MKRQILAMAFVFTALFIGTSSVPVSAAPVSADYKVTAAPSIPISGTVAGISSFVGNFDIQRFTSRSGEIYAVGTLTGTLTNLITGLTQTVSQIIQIPVDNITGSCQILHLELGPLDLDLLGLQVHLDQVVLDITAQSGSGQLLGNLLCAVANLLNSDGALSSITQLLNRILGQL